MKSFVPDIYTHHIYKKYLNQETLYFLFSLNPLRVHLDPGYIGFENMKMNIIFMYCQKDKEGKPIVVNPFKEQREIERYTISPEYQTLFKKEMEEIKGIYLEGLMRQLDILLSNLN